MESSLAKENEEIFKMRSDIISLKIDQMKLLVSRKKLRNNLLRRIMSVKDWKKRLSSLEKRLKGLTKP